MQNQKFCLVKMNLFSYNCKTIWLCCYILIVFDYMCKTPFNYIFKKQITCCLNSSFVMQLISLVIIRFVIFDTCFWWLITSGCKKYMLIFAIDLKYFHPTLAIHTCLITPLKHFKDKQNIHELVGAHDLWPLWSPPVLVFYRNF